MQIRYAGTQDIPGIDNLLSQVLTVHHNGRPDLFKANARKYNEDELRQILEDHRDFYLQIMGDQYLGLCIRFSAAHQRQYLTDIKAYTKTSRLLQCHAQCVGMQ